MSTFPAITLEQLSQIMPKLGEKGSKLLAELNIAMEKGELNTRRRQAAFLAQIGHESLDLTRWEEMPHSKPVKGCKLCASRTHKAGEQYEGRKDLGNLYPGDGVLFKGRGPIQLTGRANYRDATAGLRKALGDTFVNLEYHPHWVADFYTGLLVATWYWNSRGLSVLADVACPSPDKMDSDAFDQITKKINGGFNGKEDRDARFLRALKVLGA